MSRILIVDDETSILNALKRLLRHAPCSYGKRVFSIEAVTCNSPVAALEIARNEEFELLQPCAFSQPGIEQAAAARHLQGLTSQQGNNEHADHDHQDRLYLVDRKEGQQLAKEHQPEGQAHRGQSLQGPLLAFDDEDGGNRDHHEEHGKNQPGRRGRTRRGRD